MALKHSLAYSIVLYVDYGLDLIATPLKQLHSVATVYGLIDYIVIISRAKSVKPIIQL